jgi:hypothetical protein
MTAEPDWRVWFLLLGAIIGCDDLHRSDSLGRAVPASVADDAELLLSRCGKPSKDDSTANDAPRPPIPSRIIEYRKQRLRILFVPSEPVGDPPPYHWKLVGVVDIPSNTATDAKTAIKRLACWAGK